MTTSELTIHQPGSKEAEECLRKHSVIYGSDGQPMASIFFVFPHLLTFAHPHFKKKKVDKKAVNKMRKIAKAIGPLLTHLQHDTIYPVLEPHKEFILELDDEELCAMLNEACEFSLAEAEHGDLIGSDHAYEIFMALQRLDDKYGEHIVGPKYTYNDPDSYCGHRDIQVTFPSDSGDPWLPQMFEVAFVQIHPGGDARNMSEGRFYVPEGIDEFYGVLETLGTYSSELCTTVEIPIEFPLEQWIQKVDEEAWDSMYREEKPDADGHYKPCDLLYFYDFKGGMCLTQFAPKGESGAGVEVYRCFDVAAYKGRELWAWTPQGEVVGEAQSQVGVSATPWKKAIFEYSTGGYFKWDGPMPGTDEWNTLLEENGLTPIAPRIEKDKTKDAFEKE